MIGIGNLSEEGRPRSAWITPSSEADVMPSIAKKFWQGA